jgi:large subunit ribosomal protein L44e
MKMSKEIKTYCPTCNKHTNQTVKLYAKKPESGLSMGTRRAERKRTGYIGKVKGQAKVKKISKHQKVILICKTCGKGTERVIGTRVKKKLEIKA